MLRKLRGGFRIFVSSLQTKISESKFIRIKKGSKLFKRMIPKVSLVLTILVSSPSLKEIDNMVSFAIKTYLLINLQALKLLFWTLKDSLTESLMIHVQNFLPKKFWFKILSRSSMKKYPLKTLKYKPNNKKTSNIENIYPYANNKMRN